MSTLFACRRRYKWGQQLIKMGMVADSDDDEAPANATSFGTTGSTGSTGSTRTAAATALGGDDDDEEPESIFNQVVRYEAAQAKLVATQAQVQPRVLPPGWREAQTTEGRVYYINDVTKARQWHFPGHAQ